MIKIGWKSNSEPQRGRQVSSKVLYSTTYFEAMINSKQNILYILKMNFKKRWNDMRLIVYTVGEVYTFLGGPTEFPKREGKSTKLCFFNTNY